ncbi:hypothetical protein GL2_36510 [Microbulbifer sp. GL-2]|nr:hypothetical protein GL2_36510 [Microbulbifer sp. GL-2]
MKYVGDEKSRTKASLLTTIDNAKSLKIKTKTKKDATAKKDKTPRDAQK